MLEMKKKTVFLFSLTLLLTILSVPAFAKKGEYYVARGSIDYYVDAWTSEVHNGMWKVTLIDGELEYTAQYTERNLDEGEPEYSPVGSIDVFWHTFTMENYEVDGDTLTFTGVLHVKKLWKKLDMTREVRYWDTYDVIITVDSETFYLDTAPTHGQNWDRVGTTHTLHYSD